LVPTLGSIHYIEQPPNPDMFACPEIPDLPQFGNFCVVDENCTVYECAGTRMTLHNDEASIVGIVNRHWELTEKDKVDAIVKDALAKIKK
jgi:hypothetical protein